MQMNQAQQQAVQHKDGPMMVLAGPGSGKTFVITERTRYLIEKHNIPENRILVITFTKAAAGEMKYRFLNRMGISDGCKLWNFSCYIFYNLKICLPF